MRTLFVALGLLLASGYAYAAPAPADTNFFPIMAWNWVPKDRAVLETMREGGLTVAGFQAGGAQCLPGRRLEGDCLGCARFRL